MNVPKCRPAILMLLALTATALLVPGTGAAHAGAPVPQPTPTANMVCEGLLDQGESLYGRSLYQDAIAKLNDALTCYKRTQDRQGEGRAISDIGLIYYQLGEYDTAQKYLEQALDIRRQVGPLGGEAVTLNNLGMVYHDQGQVQKALQYYQQALTIFQQIKYQSGEADALNNIGTAYYSLGQYQEAIEYHQQAMEVYKELGDQSGIRKTLSNIGAVYERLWQYQEALKYYQQALDIRLDVEDWSGKASLLTNTGAIYHRLGQHQDALKYYQQALDIVRRINDPAGEGNVLNNIGAVHAVLGQDQTALKYYQQALDIRTRIGDRSGQASSLHNIAVVYRGRGQYQTSLEYYRQALSIYRDLKDPHGEAETLDHIGHVYFTQGQYQEALKYYRQALDLARPKDQAVEATALNDIGEVYVSLEQYEEARQYFQQALDIQRKIQNRAGESITLNNLGVVSDSLGQYREALQYHQQALDIRRALGNRNAMATTYNNMGATYESLKQYQEAIKYYQQALDIRREVADRIGEAAALDNIGVAYASMGQYPEALKHHRQALDIRREMGEREGEAISLQNLGFAYEHQGQLDQALDAYRQSIEVYESIRASATVEEIKAALAGQAVDAYEHALLLLLQAGGPSEAFNVSERARARTFLDQLGNRNFDIRAGADPKLAAREQDLVNQIGALQRKIAEGGNVDYAGLKAQLENLQATYNQVLVDLKISNPTYASLVSVSVLSAKEIQATALDNQTTLVSYFVTDEKVIAFVLDQRTLTVTSLPINRADLTSQVERLRALISIEPRGGQTQAGERTELAQGLYRTLIAPLLPHLQHSRLIIVPHQSLHYLPFAALFDASSSPLAARFTLSTAPSASSLAPQLLNRNENSGRLVAVGNPSLPAALAEPLPYAEAEAQAVAALYPQAALLTGTQASEVALRNHLPEADVIHLATHGVLDPTHPLFSALLLSGTGDKAQEDGRLEVWEIFGLDLRQANLVVLSACETALGKQSRGDEVAGMARAFLYAGTPVVVASLWPVEDEATQTLMAAFHQRVQAGGGIAAALAEAQADVRRQPRWAAPYYWAGFIVLGDGGRAVAAPHMSITPAPTAQTVTPVTETRAPDQMATRSNLAPAALLLCGALLVVAGVVIGLGIVLLVRRVNK